ncbi:MAG: M24 family metallopeptidase, partial [Anaerolineales bacterium]
MLFNKPRAIEYMRRCGIEALVATSPVNITYFTNYYFWLDPMFREYWMSPGASSNLGQAYAVFPLEGEPALVVSPQQAVNAADLWVRDLHIYGETGLDDSLPPTALPGEAERLYDVLHGPRQNATPTEALLSILKARGLMGACLGVEMEGLTPPAKEALQGALPRAAVKDCSNLIRLIRAVKSPDEIERMARSAQINEEVGMESLVLARTGGPVADIVQHYRARVTELGADFDHFAYGYRGMGIATEPDYCLADDDVLFVDFGCNYRRYYSDTGTTLAMGSPAPILLERHAALRACMAAGMQAIGPGVKASAVHSAMWQALNAHGITASNPHGHGVGLEIRDYPIIMADNGLRLRDDCIDVPSDLPLEVNMVFNLE